MLFELHKYDAGSHTPGPAVPALPCRTAVNVAKRSFTYWGEHCVECAAPGCYRSCDLYQPRTDTRCRRFTFGAFKNRNFTAPLGYGVEVSFKKWAKMQAFGNLRMSSPTRILWTQQLVQLLGPTLDVFGKLMARMTNNVRWKAVTHEGLEELMRRMDRERPAEELPDVFLLEIYNPTERAIRMHLKFSSMSEAKPGLVSITQSFDTVVTCPRGYSRHDVDFGLLRAVVSAAGQLVISMSPEADNDARLVFLSAEFVKFTKTAASRKQQNVKCLVFDLDNTLWEGVLIEGDNVTVAPEVVTLVKQLDERGILLSIASKNDHESAWKKLEELGLSEYFLYPQINWNPKSQSVRTIAQRLNIGMDAIAFIDDNPFELGEVERACPEVACLNATRLPTLAVDPRFEGSFTPDARRRRQLYRDSAAREMAQEAFGCDFPGFLAACETTLEILPYGPEQSGRVAELVQRTNQLNFSGHKHSRQELEALLADPALDKFVLQCSDRYGSYGTVGFCLVGYTADAICLRDFMLSCRVQGKLIERTFFQHLMERHNRLGATKLWVNFMPTARNKPAQQVLDAMGFQICSAESHSFASGMILSSFESLRSDIIQVRCTHASSETKEFVALK